jgi:phosphate transport system ATP-binding protein
MSTSNRPSAALQTRDLHVHYQQVHALRGVSMEIPAQEITALIGPSGCGKSTLLRCFNRMNDVIADARVSGSVAVLGEEVNRAGVDLETLRTRIGMVFQTSNPFPMSVRDNVVFGPRMGGLRSLDALEEILERSLRQADLWDELKDRLRQPALELSEGQQQRLCLARALATSPEVLLLDEPASALDPISTATIEETLLQLKSTITTVVVTHNLQQAARLADRTAFLMDGALIEYRSSTILFTRPSEELTEKYITGRFG